MVLSGGGGGGGGGTGSRIEVVVLSIFFPIVGGFLEIFYHTAIEYLKFPYKFKDSNKISIPL